MWENLKASIASVVKTNGNQEITGANLQSVLNTIVNIVGANASFAGIATPSTNPGIPDGPVFYIACEPGIYTNFGGQVLTQGINILRYTGSAWNNQQLIGIDDFPTVGSGNLAKSNGVFQDIRRSSSNIRGLDFSSFTGDVEKYTKGIIFAGFVPTSGYTPEMVEIYVLSKNKNGDGLFRLWLQFGDNDHKFQFDKSLSSLKNGINCIKASSNWGTLYLIVDISKYSDGESVIWGGTQGARVQVELLDANDTRICNWQNGYIDKINNEVEILNADVNLVHTALDAVKINIAATEIFKGVYGASGNLITQYERYSALYPVESGKLYLYTNTDYPSVAIAEYDVVFLDSSRNFIGGISRGTQDSYSSYPIVITNPSIAYIAAIAGGSSISNASSLKEVVSYVPKMIEPESLPVIQEQFRLLDFSEFTGDKQPYYESVIFAAVVWKNKPEWAVKPEIYVLSYNHHDSDDVVIAIEYGNNGTSNQSLWVYLYDVSQLDSVPKYYFKKVSQENLFDFYFIISPKAIVDYYNKYHRDIIFGGDYGTHVCTEELTSDDPRLAMFNVASQISAINTRIDNIVVHSVFWNNKKIVWYGTSIPAGSDPTLGQEGIGITYPEIAATYLGATCNNEAVGSGRAAYLAPVQNETYQHLMRCQGGTIASKLALFNDIYVIDDDNKTVTLGQNTYGVRDLPISGTPTYAQAVSLRLEAIRFSYEIKLISRYLDSTNQYLLGVLNSQEVAASIHYSGTGYELLHRDDMDYKFTPDLFVFDHGTNDFGNMTNNDDVTTRDTTKFYGAMNMMYDLIQFYAPTSLVYIVTDYGTSRYNSDLVIKEQQAWADYWQIPCLRTCDIIPWNGTIVTVQGYWDGGTAQGGQWHNEGFYFTVNGNTWETNNGIILSRYNSNTPASTVINSFNIRTIRGKQVYDIPQKYKFFKDGLHPHTDTSGNALKLYARYLSRLIDAPNKNSIDNVFIAEYGVTTVQEVKDALDSGKAVFCRKDGQLYTYTEYSVGTYFFQRLDRNLILTAAGLNVSGTWYAPRNPLKPEDRNNKVMAVSSNSTDIQYPSAKAVYTAISNAAKTVEDNIDVKYKDLNPVENDEDQYVITPLGINYIKETLNSATIIIDEGSSEKPYGSNYDPDLGWLYTVIFKTGSTPSIMIGVSSNDATNKIVYPDDFSIEANRLYELSVMYVGYDIITNVRTYLLRIVDYEIPATNGGSND